MHLRMPKMLYLSSIVVRPQSLHDTTMRLTSALRADRAEFHTETKQPRILYAAK